MSKRVIVGLSGGVDSAYVAWLLKQQNYDVVGVHFILDPFGKTAIDAPDKQSLEVKPCGGQDEALQKTAERIGIELLCVDLSYRFRRHIISRFVEEYLSGRTPNPCVLCNLKIKFDVLHRLLGRLGADYFATGHYARIVTHPSDGVPVVARAADPLKDQSYFLCMLGAQHLQKAILPLGDLRKSDVKAEVFRLGLCEPSVHASQDLCFVSEHGKYADVFKEFPRIHKPGPIVDRDEGEVGTHPGILNFTIGQRRGLGVALGQPRYAIDAETNTLHIGPKKYLMRREFVARDVVWVAGSPKDERLNLNVKIRLKHKAAPATLTPIDGEARAVRVEFHNAQPAVTPGQAAAFYDGDFIVGGGWIELP